MRTLGVLCLLGLGVALGALAWVLAERGGSGTATSLESVADGSLPESDATQGTSLAGPGLQGAGGLGPRVPPDKPAAVASIARGSAPRGACVSGRVVRDRDDKPLAGVRVRLVRPDSLRSWLKIPALGRSDRLQVVTDAEGRFAFSHVQPGSGYVVRAVPDTLPAASTELHELLAAERVELDDLVIEEAGALVARLVDANGHPVPNAACFVSWQVRSHLNLVLANPEALEETERSTTSDSEGRVRVDGLEPGDKTIVFQGPNGDTAVEYEAVVIAEETTDLGDVVLRPGVVLSGRVLHHDRAPVSDATIFVGPVQKGLRYAYAADVDSEGRFRFRSIPAAPYILCVALNGRPVHAQPGAPPTGSEVEVRLPPLGTLWGHVVDADTGEALGPVDLTLKQEGATGRFAGLVELVEQVTGSRRVETLEGSFELTALPLGSYTVSLRAEGHPEVRFEDVAISEPKPARPTPFPLPAGHTLVGTVRMRGTDEPLTGADVYVVALDGFDRPGWLVHEEPSHPWSGTEWSQMAVDCGEPVARTDGVGRFELPPRRAGPVLVIATHPSCSLPSPLRVDVGSSERELGIDLELAAELEVTVLDATGRRATQGVSFLVVPLDGGPERWLGNRNDAQPFRARQLEPGTYMALPWLPREASLLFAAQSSDAADRMHVLEAGLRELGHAPIVLRAGQESRAEIRLPRMTRVECRLVLPSGEPYTHPQTITRPRLGEARSDEWMDLVIPDEKGKFNIFLEPGVYAFMTTDAETPAERADWPTMAVPDQSSWTTEVTIPPDARTADDP